MPDTTTVLNAGTGGDAMDESLVTQADGVTQAKRPRVVAGLDDGRLISKEAPMPISDPDVVALLNNMHEELRLIRIFMQSIAGN